MMKTYAILVFFLWSTLVFSQSVFTDTVAIQQQQQEGAALSFQKEIVAKLTGYLPIRRKKKLKSRSSANERRITADYLFGKLKSDGLNAKKDAYSVENKTGDKFIGTNVYAEIPATQKSNEWVLVSAHFDSAKGSPGAIHNATGVAIAYDVILNISKLEARKKNFMIIFFDQWKSNLIGARMFFKKLKAERYKVHSIHRADYIGWDKDGDRAIELYSSNIGIETIYRNQSAVPVYKRTIATPETRYFANLGYPTVTLTAELRNYDNSPFISKDNDNYATVNFNYLSSTAAVVYRVMKVLAEE